MRLRNINVGIVRQSLVTPMILRSSSYDPIVLYRRKSRGIAKDQRRINGGMARVNVRDDARLCVLQMMIDSSYKSQLLHYDVGPS